MRRQKPRIKTMKRPRRTFGEEPCRDRAGAAMMECAVILPMMLVLVLGTIEMGTALRASTILQSSVREAGRLASMDWRYVVEDDDTPNAKVERDIRNFVTASGLPGADLVITITHAEGSSAGQTFDIEDEDNDLKLMKIQIQLPYSSISLFPMRYMGGQNVNAQITMRAGLAGGLSS